ncbi:alpha,alpha-trehalase [Martiniozyma asiatica (nom. inval.)]|nr:alpha,alpha-trehalase [Martiniozyma asiatica]
MRRRSSIPEPLASPEKYYGPKNRARTLSFTIPHEESPPPPLPRRSSISYQEPKRFFISNVSKTLESLLNAEDTDQNNQITIEDKGPKLMVIGTANSLGYKQTAIRGTYMLSNLLQELTLAKNLGRNQLYLDEERLNESPVDRLIRMINGYFWKNLTRQLNEASILEMALDTKIHSPEAKFPRVYIPHDDINQFNYYKSIQNKNPDYKLDVVYLPPINQINAEYVQSINNKPGLLALAMRHNKDNNQLEGWPYVVPGGRFNEQYGWDSYFETLGLLKSGKWEPCQGMVENFIYEINNYGKILNANRSYYLSRSQPPFLTDMALKIFIYKRTHLNITDLDFLKRSTLAAIKEYQNVWTCEPRLDPITGLSRFRPDGKGIPPETESTHFHSVLKPFCDKYGLNFNDFETKYNSGEIKENDLDVYFMHDRAVRESGHDTSYRLEGCCADLATVDLNCLLYKYETDIAHIIKTYFNDSLSNGNEIIYNSDDWFKLAQNRYELMEKYLWNEEKGLYFDYNTKTQRQSTYESVTSLYPLWSGCTIQRAHTLSKSLHKFVAWGGLVSGTEASRGSVDIDRPSRQWDYPFAWAPHQMLIWEGLLNGNSHSPLFKDWPNFKRLLLRLVYKWIFMLTFSFKNYNGVVVEKYDAEKKCRPHEVEAEYGNQGADVRGVAKEGFGWVNASYLVGVDLLDRLGGKSLRKGIGLGVEIDTVLGPEDETLNLYI